MSNMQICKIPGSNYDCVVFKIKTTITQKSYRTYTRCRRPSLRVAIIIADGRFRGGDGTGVWPSITIRAENGHSVLRRVRIGLNDIWLHMSVNVIC